MTRHQKDARKDEDGDILETPRSVQKQNDARAASVDNTSGLDAELYEQPRDIEAARWDGPEALEVELPAPSRAVGPERFVPPLDEAPEAKRRRLWMEQWILDRRPHLVPTWDVPSEVIEAFEHVQRMLPVGRASSRAYGAAELRVDRLLEKALREKGVPNVWPPAHQNPKGDLGMTNAPKGGVKGDSLDRPLGFEGDGTEITLQYFLAEGNALWESAPEEAERESMRRQLEDDNNALAIRQLGPQHLAEEPYSPRVERLLDWLEKRRRPKLQELRDRLEIQSCATPGCWGVVPTDAEIYMKDGRPVVEPIARRGGAVRFCPSCVAARSREASRDRQRRRRERLAMENPWKSQPDSFGHAWREKGMEVQGGDQNADRSRVKNTTREDTSMEDTMTIPERVSTVEQRLARLEEIYREAQETAAAAALRVAALIPEDPRVAGTVDSLLADLGMNQPQT